LQEPDIKQTILSQTLSVDHLIDINPAPVTPSSAPDTPRPLSSVQSEDPMLRKRLLIGIGGDEPP
jgi:hypothetical protein